MVTVNDFVWHMSLITCRPRIHVDYMSMSITCRRLHVDVDYMSITCRFRLHVDVDYMSMSIVDADYMSPITCRCRLSMSITCRRLLAWNVFIWNQASDDLLYDSMDVVTNIEVDLIHQTMLPSSLRSSNLRTSSTS